MPDRQYGFTLIEVLVSMMVFAIGLLGLGQFQARLWSSTGDLHATDTAYLLADNTFEKASIAHTIDADLVAGTSDPPGSSATLFDIDLAQTRREQLTETRVRIEWRHRSGSRSLQLHGTIYTASPTADARLLLPVD